MERRWEDGKQQQALQSVPTSVNEERLIVGDHSNGWVTAA